MIHLHITAMGKTTTAELDMGKGLQSPLAKRIFAHRLREAGVKLTAEMKKTSPRDTGRLSNSHGSVVDESASQLIVFNRANYSVPVHEGRAAGKKAPPYEALIAWARRHLVNNRILSNKAKLDAGTSLKANLNKSATKDEQKQARQLAFLVARAIGKRGIKPRPWFADVIKNGGLEIVTRSVNLAVADMADLYGKWASDLLVTSVNQGVK
jgi:hypothetical protein